MFCARGLAFPLSVTGQQAGARRIGFFYNGSRRTAMDTGRYPAFLQGMRELGYVEGKDFVVAARFAPELNLFAPAMELVHANVEVIVSSGGAAVSALKQATSAVPVVFATTIDPVRGGYAASFARPGGNFTGLSTHPTDGYPKHVELLQLAVPRLSRIAALANSANINHAPLLEIIQSAARARGVEVVRVGGDTIGEIEQGIGAIARQRIPAFIILGSAFFVQYFPQIAGFALRNRLASIYAGAEYPEAGGLMSYGPNIPDNYRRAATYVDKILKGAKPGDLPIEQPARFELVVNRKAASALRIPLSGELLFRADRVIE